jgi:hypothetical protein
MKRPGSLLATTQWLSLASAYPRTRSCSGSKWRRQRIRINDEPWRPVRTTVGADETGLFLGRSAFLGLFVLPSIEISWSDLRREHHDEHGPVLRARSIEPQHGPDPSDSHARHSIEPQHGPNPLDSHTHFRIITEPLLAQELARWLS